MLICLFGCQMNDDLVGLAREQIGCCRAERFLLSLYLPFAAGIRRRTPNAE